MCSKTSRTFEFQSTLPVKGATMSENDLLDLIDISIHAPGKGSDQDILR